MRLVLADDHCGGRDDGSPRFATSVEISKSMWSLMLRLADPASSMLPLVCEPAISAAIANDASAASPNCSVEQQAQQRRVGKDGGRTWVVREWRWEKERAVGGDKVWSVGLTERKKSYKTTKLCWLGGAKQKASPHCSRIGIMAPQRPNLGAIPIGHIPLLTEVLRKRTKRYTWQVTAMARRGMGGGARRLEEAHGTVKRRRTEEEEEEGKAIYVLVPCK